MLVGLVLGLGWYAGYTYHFKGRQESLTIKENQLEALEQKNRRSRSLAARRDDLNQRMAMYERQLLIFEEFIPQSEEVPELLDAISREAALTGVELARIRPRAATQGEGFYARQTWEESGPRPTAGLPRFSVWRRHECRAADRAPAGQAGSGQLPPRGDVLPRGTPVQAL